jgi:hypothetical protein
LSEFGRGTGNFKIPIFLNKSEYAVVVFFYLDLPFLFNFRIVFARVGCDRQCDEAEYKKQIILHGVELNSKFTNVIGYCLDNSVSLLHFVD